MYEKRRYKVQDGRLLKKWLKDGDTGEGWYQTKEEAFAAISAPALVEEEAAPKRRGRPPKVA